MTGVASGKVRHARPTDAPAIRMLQSYLRRAAPSLVPHACAGPLVGVIAEARGYPVGFAIAVPAPAGTPATIAELVVAPAGRRAGRGRALIEAVDDAVETNRVAVTTPVDAEGARKFYRRAGFEHDRTLPGFYTDTPGVDDCHGTAVRLVRGDG